MPDLGYVVRVFVGTVVRFFTYGFLRKSTRRPARRY